MKDWSVIKGWTDEDLGDFVSNDAGMCLDFESSGLELEEYVRQHRTEIIAAWNAEMNKEPHQ